jgi:hypothetical protein
MPRVGLAGGTFAVILSMLLLPASASAQATTASGIAGVVRDASGAVLPGVTVEASSPALIEKVRTVVTDGEGRYNIIDLRSGTYVVTFVLPGFSTFRRDGIILQAGFTATVNADMRLGTIEETVTVSGESPLVDTQSARRQTVMSADMLNVLPSSVKNLNNLVTLTPGFKGNEGFDISGGYTGQVGASYHGKGGTKVNFDGMSIQHASGNQGYNQNQDTVDETVLSISGITAETNADGVQINLVPKEGSNLFSGSTNGLYSGKSLQSDNLSDKLKARGLLSVTNINYLYDAGTNLGGPIFKDRMWFYGAFREWGNDRGAAGKFYNKTQGTFFYTPDLSKPAFTHEWMESKALRLTTMIGSKNKINLFADNQRDCHCPALVSAGSINAPEAFFSYKLSPAGLYQATWSAPFTSKLLAEAGIGVVHGSWPQESQPEVGPNDVAITEQTTGVQFGNLASRRYHQHVPRRSQRGSLSYVTGSHAIKGGFQFEESTANFGTTVVRDLNFTVRDGIPVSLTQWATPYFEQNRNKDWGWFIQDQWTQQRLTLNYGLRFERFHGYIPAQHVDATSNGWVPARDFAAVKNVPLWKDWNPRVGAAYDLFGDGRTALKFSIGRFVAKTSVTITQSVNPIVTSVNNVNRTWTDANNNRIPDCDLANRQANGECGAMANLNFGGTNITTRYADDAINGWGVRGNNWDMSAEVQHQLTRGVSMTAGYYRNWYGNFTVTDNTLVTPADYNTYCITAPKDTRLPNGGGYQVCGLADVSLAKFGQVNSVITQASHFGEQKQINDFFNVTISTRLPNGMMLGGGVDTGRSVTDNCFVVDSPQQLVNCHQVTGFEGNTQYKAFGSYTLPRDVIVSLVFQNIAGPPITATYAVANDQIAPSLGRNLAACGTRSPCTSTVNVPLVTPGTMFDDRMERLDLRLAKRIRLTSRVAFQGNFNIYNVFNASAVNALNTTFGPRWLEPSRVEDGRLLQFSASVTY